MSHFIIDIYTELDFNKIIIGKPVIINEEMSKIYLYYMDQVPKEIFIKIPSVRLIYGFKNLKYNQIKLPLYPKWEGTTKFIKLIKKIEKHIRLSINLENSIFVNSFDKNDNLSTLKLNINNKVKINSVINTSLNELKVNGEIEGIISMSYVWIKQNSYGLSLSCYQFKYYPKVEEYDFDFFDSPSDIERDKQIIIKHKEINIDKKEINRATIIDTPQINVKPMMMISSSILNDAITKLNRTKTS